MGFKIKKFFKSVTKPVAKLANNKLVQGVARGAAAYATGGTSEVYLQSAQKAQALLKKAKSSQVGEIVSDGYKDAIADDTPISNQASTSKIKNSNSQNRNVFQNIGDSVSSVFSSGNGNNKKTIYIFGGVLALIALIFTMRRKS